MSSASKTTIWIWPTGLFPRRLMYYFRAKGLSTSDLQTHNIHLIPVVLVPEQGALLAKPGYEARPEGTSLPCLRIERPNEEDFFIHESTAILEYFEDLFNTQNGFKDIRGDNIYQRARSRDIVSVLHDATVWSNVHVMHTEPSSVYWSGITREQWSEAVAVDARKRVDAMFSRVEGWVGGSVPKGCMSLAGEGEQVTLIDICLLAIVEYAAQSYGADWLAGHDILKIWCDRIKTAEWFISGEALKEVEEKDFEGLFTL